MTQDKKTKLAFELEGKTVEVRASLAGDALTVDAGSGEKRFSVQSPVPGEILLRREDGSVVRAFVADGPGDDEVSVAIEGRVLRLPKAKDARARRGGHAHDAALEAPMPGTCRDVFVKKGDQVEKGARLVLIEAMKMEHELKAPRAGKVKAVNATKGGPVAPGTPLVELE